MWVIREQLFYMLSYIAELSWLFTSLFWDLPRAEQKYSSASCHVSFHEQNYSLFHLLLYTFTFAILKLPLKLFHIVSPGAHGGENSRRVPFIKGITICYFSSQFYAMLARILFFLLFFLDPLLPCWANKNRQIAASFLPFPLVIPGTLKVSNRNIQHPKVVIPSLRRLLMPSSICCTFRNS